ncbi:MAG: heme lyase NrfEFG subunit NrfE, partial [Parvibaculales bacterium]
MIAEFGHFVLVLALAVALVQALAPLYLMQRDTALALPLARRAALAQFILVLLAFLALTYGFVRSDFSLAVVFANSHVAKPLIYKIAGVWGNHEGSMLLWVLIVAAYGAAYAAFSKTQDGFSARVLMVQGWLGVAFLAFLL